MAAIPQQMQVIEITKPGGPEVLQPATRPVPQPGPGEVLIEVAAAGVNRPDCFQRAGSYAPPPGASDLPGLEVAGTIAQLGAGVTQWKVGDAVCALTPGGGYAQYCVTPAGQCLPVPKGLSLVEAASLPETFFTVWINVFERAKLAAGRDAAGAGRQQRHRRDRDPDGARLRPPRVRHGGQRREVRGVREAGRRARHQLPERGLRRGGQAAHRRQGRGRDPRHGRRRLRAARAQVPGHRRAAVDHRLPGRHARPPWT